MNILEKKIKGVYEIILTPLNDERGYFMRTYDYKVFEYFGIHRDWVQENHSRSEKKGIIRGLHFQFPPYNESKLIRCIKGAVLDIYLDLRKDSPSFGRWETVELSEQNKKMLFLPRGFAHGFCTLTEVSEVVYKVDNFFSKDHDSGIRWNDPTLRMRWPVENPVISEKDMKLMTFDEFVNKYKNLSEL